MALLEKVLGVKPNIDIMIYKQGNNYVLFGTQQGLNRKAEGGVNVGKTSTYVKLIEVLQYLACDNEKDVVLIKKNGSGTVHINDKRWATLWNKYKNSLKEITIM